MNWRKMSTLRAEGTYVVFIIEISSCTTFGTAHLSKEELIRWKMGTPLRRSWNHSHRRLHCNCDRFLISVASLLFLSPPPSPRTLLFCFLLCCFIEFIFIDIPSLSFFCCHFRKSACVCVCVYVCVCVSIWVIFLNILSADPSWPCAPAINRRLTYTHTHTGTPTTQDPLELKSGLFATTHSHKYIYSNIQFPTINKYIYISVCVCVYLNIWIQLRRLNAGSIAPEAAETRAGPRSRHTPVLVTSAADKDEPCRDNWKTRLG